MAKSRVKKEGEVRDIAKGLKEAKTVVFANLAGLKVSDATDFRRKAKKENVEIQSAKRTLLRIALKENPSVTIDEASLKGSVALLFGYGDEVAPAKLLEELRKERESVGVLGGLFGAKWMTSEEVKTLAKLPSKQQLIAQVVGTIRAPLSGLMNALQGNLRNIVYVINAIKDSKA